MSEIERINDYFENTDMVQPLMDVIKQIMELPEDSVNENTIESIGGAINGAFTPTIREQLIKQMLEVMESNSLTRAEAQEQHNDMVKSFDELIEELQPSINKRKLLTNVFQTIIDLSNAAVERYHSYAINLPIQLEEGARVPTYAHETDAAADLYALTTTNIPAHSYGNVVHTGVKIQLPESWLALIFPRSSTGKNTPLRISNSVGLIDSGYRGELMVLLDNTSDSDFSIQEGNRIAQLLVMPSYRFKPQVVESLEDSDRGEGGVGSTGV